MHRRFAGPNGQSVMGFNHRPSQYIIVIPKQTYLYIYIYVCVYIYRSQEILLYRYLGPFRVSKHYSQPEIVLNMGLGCLLVLGVPAPCLGIPLRS